MTAGDQLDHSASLAMPPPPLFRLLKSADAAAAATTGGARLGTLALPGRQPVATPNFFAVTSRGAVPHVTPDNIARHSLAGGAYLAVEDFVERVPLHQKRQPPIYGTPAKPPTSRLHSFTALPSSTISVLAPRRHPAAASHLGNGPEHISIVTSTGFQRFTVDDYINAVRTLEPDIAIPMADLTYSGDAGKAAARPTAVSVQYPTAKRATRMAERTEDWIDQWYYKDDISGAVRKSRIFAPTLPVPYATQWQYLNRLAELSVPQDAEAEEDPKGLAESQGNGRPMIEGLTVYDVDLLPDLDADYADSLAPLPRLSLHPAPTPQHMLRQIALGVDILLLPIITAASEAGLAFVFKWEAEEGNGDVSNGTALKPLAIDLTDSENKMSTEPLVPGCTCPACSCHHRAYIHHLLDAREMLAWTLLQVHNHHVVGTFLEGVRESLKDKEVFDTKRRQFNAKYEPELPVGHATRPRNRGYQIPKNGREASPSGAEPPRKLNKPAWGRLEEVPGATAPAAASSTKATTNTESTT